MKRALIDNLTEIAIQKEYTKNFFDYIAKLIGKAYDSKNVIICSEETIIGENQTDNSSLKNLHCINIPYVKDGKILIYDAKKNSGKDTDLILASLLSIMIKNKYLIDKKNEDIKSLQIDPLTGLQSRSLYENRLNNFNEENIGICYIDTNYLKKINDKFGHDIGDEFLKLIASAITKVFRESDCYRIGGDEIVIISSKIEEKLFNKKINNLINLINLKKEEIIARCMIKNEEILGELVSYGTYYKEKATSEEIRKIIREAESIMQKRKKEFHKKHNIKR